ncbi:hypothetical protein R1sor_003834 [Riccia sorocarpa]|uniref:Uncharacterized protein n=1 Tax=Riccia sorocarpa TaxID=122646 RepID=A0ABD3H5L2_9MARC
MASLSLINPCLQCCSISSSSLAGHKLQLNAPAPASSRTFALRAKPVCQSQDGFKLETISKQIKKAGAAAAAALLLSGAVADVSLAQIGGSTSSPTMGADNPIGSAEEILNKAKQVGNENFAEAQRKGVETVGETASASPETAPPAISQVVPDGDEASEPTADAIAARADLSAQESGTKQQQGIATNPIEKNFATPTRGIGDKEGENVAQISNRDKFKNEIPGQGTSGEKPIPSSPFDGIFDRLRESASNRDEGKSADQNVYGTNAK